MDCKETGEQLLDVAAGEAAAPALQQHLASCAACAGRLQGLRQTLTLLDEWQAPEPSPYFDTRLHARLREEAAAPARGLLQWLRKPVLAAAMAVLMTAGLLSLYHSRPLVESATVAVPAEPGTAVGDLQELEKNHDLFANFDLLDDLDEEAHPSAQTATP